VSGVTMLMVGLLAIAGTVAAGFVAMILVGCWLLLVVVESLRVSGVSSAANRMMRALLVIHCGLVLGFWRGLLDMRRLTLPGHGGGPWRNSRAS
jgi:hypothetical protein